VPIAPEASSAVPSAPASEWIVARLTSGMKDGNEAAWGHFHRTYYFPLLGCAARLGSKDPEEAVQLTYLRVARHVKTFSDEGVFWRWLHCLLRCVALDAHRHQSRSLVLLEKFQQWQEFRSATTSRPEDAGSMVERALSAMDADSARLLRLKYCEGWETAELASDCGCTIKAMESRLGRARADLKRRILEDNSHA
jgi:RNA polymerase sigma factor (sigma-70 family)